MNKHIVRHEDGTVSKRNSANRTYPFAIEVGPDNLDMAIAERIAFAEKSLARAQEKLALFIASGKKVNVVKRSFVRDVNPDIDYKGDPCYHNFEFKFAGDGVHTPWCNSKGESTEGYPEVTIVSYEDNCAKIEARLYAVIDACEQELAEALALTPETIKHVQRGWGIITWCGRADLAVKQLDKWNAHYANRGNTVRIVSTETP
jgi:hypothetical protein